jgi:cytochrome c oxidase cbb3-type subunit 4
MTDATLGVMRGLTTLLAMIAFVAVCVWAWSRRRQKKFDDAARLPLEDDAP